MPKERIGILENSFDPIHQGQIRMALSAIESARLDLVYVIPSADDAFHPCAAGKEDRWKMTVVACTQDQRLIPSRLEMDQSFPSVKMKTLLSLKAQHPEADLFWIIDDEDLLHLYRWPNLKELIRLSAFLVFPSKWEIPQDVFIREKSHLSSLSARIILIRPHKIGPSLSAVRHGSSRLPPVRHLFPPVLEFCCLKGLYGVPRKEGFSDVWIEKLFRDLNPRRFAHSLSVAQYSHDLALRHGVSALQAEQAGLLHDCAKCMPLKEMRRIATQHSLTNDPAVLESNALMHSLVGAWVARNEYGMADPEVLEAISYHNTGHAGMSRLAMCVCLADSIEPTRGDYPHLRQIRALSDRSLEKALLMSLEETASYVHSRGKYLHPRTQETISWLKTLPEVYTGRNESRNS